METTILREKLHAYIDTAGDDKIAAIYTILEEAIENYIYDEAEIKLLEERHQNYINGSSKTFPVEEAHNLVRKNKK